LRRRISFLLALSLWFQHLPGLHGRKHMGHVLQCHYLAVPGLRGAEWIRQSVSLQRTSEPELNTGLFRLNQTV
jgi:hypothetical protein